MLIKRFPNKDKVKLPFAGHKNARPANEKFFYANNSKIEYLPGGVKAYELSEMVAGVKPSTPRC